MINDDLEKVSLLVWKISNKNTDPPLNHAYFRPWRKNTLSLPLPLLSQQQSLTTHRNHGILSPQLENGLKTCNPPLLLFLLFFFPDTFLSPLTLVYVPHSSKEIFKLTKSLSKLLADQVPSYT